LSDATLGTDTNDNARLQVKVACHDIWTFALQALDHGNFGIDEARGTAAIGHLVLWPLLAMVHCPLVDELEAESGRALLQGLGEHHGMHTAYRANGSTWFE
jgi:hypothetical protein